MITREELEELLEAWDALESITLSPESDEYTEAADVLRGIIELFRPRLETPAQGEPDPSDVSASLRAPGHVVAAPDAYSGNAPLPKPGVAEGDRSALAFRELFRAAAVLIDQGPSASGWAELGAAVAAARPFVS